MADSAVAGLACPNCGAAITVRALQQTQTVVCPSCHAVLDSRDQRLSVLQQFQAKMAYTPDIPLGSRGTLRGDVYEVNGFQVRRMQQNAAEYFWREYTLWNPYKGYRYLMEYDGHWCDFDITRIAPSELVTGRQPFVRYDGTPFLHFRTTTVTTAFILGEFPWQLRSGDHVTSRDFIAPPRMLSEEVSPSATVWALGSVVPGEVIWHAFSLPGAPPPAKGVFLTDENPFAPLVQRRLWLGALAAAPVIGIALLRASLATQPAWVHRPVSYAAIVALAAIPAALAELRRGAFERARWRASDYDADDNT